MRFVERGFIGFLTLLLVASCESSTVRPSLQVAGRVTLFDEVGVRLSTAEQVSVTLLDPGGTAVLAETSTDATGQFSLELPDEGVFSLAFRKDGFGTMYRYGVDHTASAIQARLFARSSAVVSSVQANAELCGVPCLRLVLGVDNFFGVAAGRRVFRVFLGTYPGISPTSYQVADLLFVPNDQPGLERDGSAARFVLDGLFGLIHSFAPGRRVYVLVHAATENLTNSFIDPFSGVEIFTDLSPDHARSSFIMP